LYDLSDEELKIKTFLSYDGNIEEFLPELKTIDHLDTRLVVSVGSDQVSGVPLSVITEQIEEIIENSTMPE
jgi:hypothetical protein